MTKSIQIMYDELVKYAAEKHDGKMELLINDTDFLNKFMDDYRGTTIGEYAILDEMCGFPECGMYWRPVYNWPIKNQRMTFSDENNKNAIEMKVDNVGLFTWSTNIN